MTDAFAHFATGLESPASHLHTVIPSDTEDLPEASRGINVAVSGNVRITTVSGSTSIVHVAAGIAFPIRARRIWSTGTTASGIVAMS